MSFSLREKVAEGRMRGGLMSFSSLPPHPIFLPEGSGEKGHPAGFFPYLKAKKPARRVPSARCVILQ
jgi:hypothetical protein